MARGDVRAALANAPRYLRLVGHVAIAWTWLRQARVARAAAPASDADRDFYAGKLAACRWFFVHELPTIEHDARLLAALDRCALDTPPGVL
jgi:butyryl-CoA dehydrogenase